MKKVIKGWMGNRQVVNDLVTFGGQFGQAFRDKEDGYLRKTKGTEKDWFPTQWPPKHVTITIEVDER